MHAPSSLLAGIVLTFGITALANLYLPQIGDLRAEPRGPSGASAPFDDFDPSDFIFPDLTEEERLPVPSAESPPLAEVGTDPTVEAAASPPAEEARDETAEPEPAGPSSAPDASSASVAQQPRSAEPADNPPPVASGGARAPAAAERVQPTQRAAALAQPSEREPQEPRPLARPVEETPAPPRAARTAAPRPHEEQRPSVPEEPAPPASRATLAAAPRGRFAAPEAGQAGSRGPGEATVSVSAILGERAWIRVGDTHTLTVHPGDEVPGFGAVRSIDGDTVLFENGQNLKVTM